MRELWTVVSPFKEGFRACPHCPQTIIIIIYILYILLIYNREEERNLKNEIFLRPLAAHERNQYCYQGAGR